MQPEISVQILFQIDFVFLHFCTSAVSMEEKGWIWFSTLVFTSLITMEYISGVIWKSNLAFRNVIFTLKLTPTPRCDSVFHGAFLYYNKLPLSKYESRIFYILSNPENSSRKFSFLPTSFYHYSSSPLSLCFVIDVATQSLFSCE